MSGNLRTWNLIKGYQLDSLKTIYSDNFDLFMSVWNTNTASENFIRNYYKNNNTNLINLNFVDTFNFNIFFNKSSLCDISTNSYKSFYLKNLSVLDKKKYEFQTGNFYERVIFTRPDILLFYSKNKIKNEQIFLSDQDRHDFSFQLSGDFNDIDYPSTGPSTNDIHTIGGLLSSDILPTLCFDIIDLKFNNKLKLKKGNEAHSLFGLHIKKHLITVESKRSNNIVEDTIRPQVVRPTMDIKNLANNYKNWDTNDLFEPGYCPKWTNIKQIDMEKTIQDRIKSCIEKNIDLDDYELKKFVR